MISMKIGKETFEIVDHEKSPKKWETLVSRASQFDGKTLHQVYDRYSNKKERIFDYWRAFCYENNGCRDTWGYSGFAIVSHNHNFFSLSFMIDNDKIKATALITPAHNYLILNR